MYVVVRSYSGQTGRRRSMPSSRGSSDAAGPESLEAGDVGPEVLSPLALVPRRLEQVEPSVIANGIRVWPSRDRLTPWVATRRREFAISVGQGSSRVCLGNSLKTTRVESIDGGVERSFRWAHAKSVAKRASLWVQRPRAPSYRPLFQAWFCEPHEGRALTGFASSASKEIRKRRDFGWWLSHVVCASAYSPLGHSRSGCPFSASSSSAGSRGCFRGALLRSPASSCSRL